MTPPTNTGNPPPRKGLSGPESAENPEVGTEQHPGGVNGPQAGAQRLRSELTVLDPAPDSGPTVAECRDHDRRWDLERHGE